MDFEIRKDRNRQGRKPLTRERAAYFQLMEQGYSAREAARIVGIDRRTGKKWRNGHKRGRKAVPPIYQDLGHASGAAEDLEAPSCGPSRLLQERDRTHIADRLREKACDYCNLRNHATRVSREAVLIRGPMGVLGPLSVRPGDLVGRLAVSTTVYVHLTGTVDHRDVFLSESQKERSNRLCLCVSRAVASGSGSGDPAVLSLRLT
ncbi:helix-turn-helix domain-containing protein [Streptomyces sp. NPDC057367]|uniref:helix-turn-helix domain-containing protein n=1 Tax=Streptomyces sp. NPDC057367 TaxID=3346108 RepID=UPI00362E04FA